VRQLDRKSVAAWLLKANPSIYDAEGALRDLTSFGAWRLAPSYRVGLIAVEDPVVLWLTGRDRGIIAAGEVTGAPYESTGGTDYWVDDDEKAKVRPYLPVRLEPIPKITEDELTTNPAFNEAEVLKIRQMGNPSYLTEDEFDVIKDLMGMEFVASIWRTG
jgi:hypothetical protein